MHVSAADMNLDQAVILLAEDDKNDVFFMQRAFSKAGLANPLKIVPDGEAVIQYLKGKEKYPRESNPFPVLLLLDLHLPKKNGFEVLEWLRTQPVVKRLPTVILTASSEGPDINRAYDLGANSYLIKPPTPEALKELAERIGGFWLTLNTPPA
jgi:CheY-like chemotaxis protein